MQTVRSALFEQQKELQVQAASSAALNIRRSLELTMANLATLAQTAPLQSGVLDGDEARGILRDNFDRLDIVMDRLVVLDASGVVRVDMHRQGLPDIEGWSLADRDYVRAVQATKEPSYSNSYNGADGRHRIAITHPIVDKLTGKYLGAVSTSTCPISFFEKFDNVHDPESRYMIAYDRNAVVLASPIQNQVGKSIFGEEFGWGPEAAGSYGSGSNDVEEFQKFTSTILSGRSAEQVFGSGAGERLVVGQPVILDGRPAYFIDMVNPTPAIYSDIDRILFGNNLMTFGLLAATSSAVAVLVLIVFRWNVALDAKVQERTVQLREKADELTTWTLEIEARTKELEVANEQLKVHDRMQKEFINIAAHELRTPVQPIIGMVQLLGVYPKKGAAGSRISAEGEEADEEEEGGEEMTVKRRDMKIIARNAARLERLSSDILDITRIESNTLRLAKGRVDIDQLASDAVEDAKRLARNGDVRFALRPSGGLAVVEADRGRVMQVLSNLLINAIKFTEAGTITVTVGLAAADDKGSGGGGADDGDSSSKSRSSSAIVSVRDTGCGLDPDVTPRLFTRFSSTAASTSGTGLGLYISRAIVEAHGGRIWAQNNADGPGTTFTFTLPAKE
jgi:signal transduction histidine kinase